MNTSHIVCNILLKCFHSAFAARAPVEVSVRFVFTFQTVDTITTFEHQITTGTLFMCK